MFRRLFLPSFPSFHKTIVCDVLTEELSQNVTMPYVMSPACIVVMPTSGGNYFDAYVSLLLIIAFPQPVNFAQLMNPYRMSVTDQGTSV